VHRVLYGGGLATESNEASLWALQIPLVSAAVSWHTDLTVCQAARVNAHGVTALAFTGRLSLDYLKSKLQCSADQDSMHPINTGSLHKRGDELRLGSKGFSGAIGKEASHHATHDCS
jgi:hypothetical protein